ncbi:MAG TPA: Rieske (2Fe-2S) protein [Candidatus Dormibacteraeota bacterium]|nr:Rieske (2Fe-2S) protein [Candidatus Dormibacteraeota bacterium]
MFENLEDRIDRAVDGLLKGRRLRVKARDAGEREAIIFAAELAAVREAHPRMTPAFRRRLTALLAGEDRAQVTRRTALGAVAGLAAGVAGAAALGRLAGGAETAPARGAPAIAGGVMKAGAGRWVPVALLSDLSQSAPTRVVAGDVVAFLFRDGDSVRGISGICSHANWPCTLNWSAAPLGVLVCPCHDVKFAPDGRTTEVSYDLPPLPGVQVKVVAGQVLVYAP